MEENSVKNEYIKFWFENGILISRFQEGVELDLVKIKELIRIREEISRGEMQYWLYDITNLKSVSKEVRDYADRYGQDYLNGVAVLVNSHITKFMFNTYLKLNKPKVLFQVFANKEKAVEWLLEIKTENTKL
ncbi:DUF7793 family protein [Flavobacterium undicola]|uniref:DUF7793 family protein n=1 Tax=Flavobacterium undicola TaxID=1932779 RepID=UPI0013774C0C|nr:STAS/SEC14 domain-containing protein [Flavobacterium undicola]MBA0884158.1 hypothetical protein [Flavobacterium undicola]